MFLLKKKVRKGKDHKNEHLQILIDTTETAL